MVADPKFFTNKVGKSNKAAKNSFFYEDFYRGLKRLSSKAIGNIYPSLAVCKILIFKN
jgi:hypothetical protein